MEGFWGILKCEMYYRNHFETYKELVAAVEQFVHYYNHQRRQHKLNCLPPATYRSLLEAVSMKTRAPFLENPGKKIFVFSLVYLTGSGSL